MGEGRGGCVRMEAAPLCDSGSDRGKLRPENLLIVVQVFEEDLRVPADALHTREGVFRLADEFPQHAFTKDLN